MLSQHVEASYAGDLLAAGSGAVGYLLKDRVARVGEFLNALDRVARGGTVLDPRGPFQRGLPPGDAQHRRVLAVLAYLRA